MNGLNITLIVLLAVACISVLAWFIIKGIKNNWFSKLYETLKKAIKEAEESGKSGVEKKAFVLQKIEEQCEKLGIPYKLILGLISKTIDEIVKNHNLFIK